MVEMGGLEPPTPYMRKMGRMPETPGNSLLRARWKNEQIDYELRNLESIRTCGSCDWRALCCNVCDHEVGGAGGCGGGFIFCPNSYTNWRIIALKVIRFSASCWCIVFIS